MLPIQGPNNTLAFAGFVSVNVPVFLHLVSIARLEDLWPYGFDETVLCMASERRVSNNSRASRFTDILPSHEHGLPKVRVWPGYSAELHERAVCA